MNLKNMSLTFPKYELGVLGGTFDHLHAGQKTFLEKGFNVCQKILIGLTSEKFTQDKLLSSAVLPFKKRKEELEDFLKVKGFLERVKIVKIDDPFPPEIFNSQIECLIITKKNEKNAEILNLKRMKKKLRALRIIKIPIVVNERSECLSSEKIRLGEMDRKGRVFVAARFFKKTHFLPRGIRPLLKKPLGRLILGSEKKLAKAALKVKEKLQVFSPVFLLTVGDVATLSLVKEGVVPDLSIVDFKVKRKEIYQDISELGFSSNIRVKEAINEPGTLNPELFETIKQEIKISLFSKLLHSIRHPELVSEPVPNSFRESIERGIPKPVRNDGKHVGFTSVIRVLGEEDLAGLAAVLLSPLNALVCYGQPEKGIVVVEVTEKKKQEFKRLLHQFQEKETE